MMNTTSITADLLASSVIAVPPLARSQDGALSREPNQQIIQHLETGGVTTLLYGGNAILYHLAVSEYAALLSLLADAAGPNTCMIPSVGPAYGTMMDQVSILRDYSFPTVMILPTRDVSTYAGIGRGVRRFVEALGRPAVLYIKHDGYVDIDTVRRLVDDGLVAWIKYAIVRENPADDPFLRQLVDSVNPSMIVSGIGEQPAIEHMRGFGLISFTSGCVCIAPRLSMKMLNALRAEDYQTAEQIRSTFQPLEDLRNSINPIRVLHAALALAGIAETGPVMPLLSEIDETDRPAIADAASQLLAADNDAAQC